MTDRDERVSAYRDRLHDAINRGFFGVEGATAMDWDRLRRAVGNAAAVRDAELDRLRALAAECSCGKSYETHAGPEPDCAVHGAVRALSDAQAELDRLHVDLSKALEDRDGEARCAVSLRRELEELRANANRWLAEQRAEVDRLSQENDRLHTWDGLLALLDEHWPEDIFPTEADSEDRDPGPRIMSLLRWVDRLAAERNRAEAQLAEAQKKIEDLSSSLDRVRKFAYHQRRTSQGRITDYVKADEIIAVLDNPPPGDTPEPNRSGT